MRKQNGTSDVTEVAFDSLLRRAARVSTPGPAGSAARPFFAGHALLEGRLRVRHRIGAGGMGVVYEVYDERRRDTVALKTLNRLDAQGIYGFKLEFRSLADVTHPNVCRLHELFSEGDDWFFTMELVRGQPFDRWARSRGRFDEARLRAAWPQLCDGVLAIHGAGKLHRDLKPSNVLVTEEGRPVVLDFGLAVDQAPGGLGQTVRDASVTGTPAYMAPEQAAGAVATPASDFYALGAMLFEALTGRRPFDGTLGEVLAAKQRDAAPRVGLLCPTAPADLAALCDTLLEREPARRPDAVALRASLGPSHRVVPTSRPSDGSPDRSPDRSPDLPPALAAAARTDPLAREPLLGREAELMELRSAYDATILGRAVVVFVAGESGMGKSALVGEFLDGLRLEGQAAVLTGRCYERESVPFKAFDSVVDDLSRYLRRLTRELASALMPRDVFALARLFPALDRVATVAEAPRRDIPDPRELQQRAFAAFAELLGRIRDRRPLVVYVDDLQWTDRDSSTFMEYLFVQPEPTPLLLILSHRSEGAGDHAPLQQALRSAHKSGRLDCRHVSVGPLPVAAARQLAQRMFGDLSAHDAAAIAEEARGSPFFLDKLVHHTHSPGSDARRVTLEQAVMCQVQALPAPAKALLDVLAVGGRPLPVQLALDAAGAVHAAVDQLLSERLLRAGGDGGLERTLECYHDKIREYVFTALEPAPLRLVHERLAEQLSARGAADPEHLALHLHGAGQHELAATHYERAGDASAAALAFDHAARLYEQALALVGSRPASPLRVKLGSALASAGSSRAAAEMYCAACVDAPPALALEHMCTAAHLLTTSGYLDKGHALLREVLSAIGLAIPRSRRGAIASAVLSRARLKLRGLRLSAPVRPARNAEANLRALWTVVQGSLGNDPFLMVEMSGRYTRLALDAGAKAHAARALSMEAYLGSFDGPPTWARSEGLLAHAQALADDVAEPELNGWVQEIRGCVLVHEGRFAEARPVLCAAVEWLETRCKGVPFELACGRGYDLNAANHLGDFAEISRKASTIVENSMRRGDMYQASGVASFAVQGWLAHRGLGHAQDRFGEAKRQFQPQTNFQWADFLMLVAELYLALYQGTPRTGLLLAGQRWPALERSQLLRMRIADAMIQYCRAGCVLAAARQGDQDAEIGLVSAAVRRLKKSPLIYARGWAAVLDAGLSQGSRYPDRAAASLRSAINCFDASGLRMYAAAARRRLGRIIGGDEGARSLAQAETVMAAEGVVDLEATTEMLAPGGWTGQP
jgi:hypothetical protein